MKKSLLYTALGLMGIMGALAIGVVNAETTITEPYGHIDYMLNGNEQFEAKVITITDLTDTITILDRNLGAKKAGTGCEDPNWLDACAGGDDTYGYHFQWGNNYGFNPTDETIQTNAKSVSSYGAEWDDSGSYNNSGYYGTTFITGDISHGYDYWQDSTSLSSNHENLRGGGGDYNDTNNGFGKNNENRRGPCPEGFHVPSYGELQKLQSMLNADGKRNMGTLHNELLIPFAGLRDANNASVYNMGYHADLWSSSPVSTSNSYSRMLSLYVHYDLDMFNNNRAYALSVRCFYDSYQPFTQSFTLSFTGSEGGSISTGSIEVYSGSTISRDNELGTVTISGAIVATGVADEGYVFSGWLTDCGNIVTTGCSFTGEFKLITYEIKYELDGGTNSQNNVTGYTIKDPVTFENPTKDNHTFEGRYTDAGFTDKITSIPTGSTGNITLYAKWKKKSSGWSGGGGRSSKTGDTQDYSDKSSEGQTGSQEILSPADDSFTKEQKDAYTFAFKNGITNMNTIDKANMDGYIKRGHLAKMVVNYVTNVLGREIPSDIPASCLSFNDESTVRESEEIKDYAIKSCALGLMGIRMKNNEFLPNDYVTRAEFGAVLSRILRGDKYNLVHTQEKPRYTDHLNALKNEGIMTKIDNPKMLEKRGYVMIMIMRSTQ